MKSLQEIIDRAKQKGPVGMAVVLPHDLITLLAIKEGIDAQLIRPELFGDRALILPLLEEAGLSEKEILLSHDENGALGQAIASVREGRNKLLMKGSIPTPELLRAVLDKEKGLGAGKVCSHAVVCEIPDFGRLLIITDGGLNVLPTVDEKADIIKNAVALAHALEIGLPKVALLASIEEVSTRLPATTDAAILTQMARRGGIKGAVVDGPLAIDNIVSPQAAQKKSIQSEVAGQADIIVVPSVEVGNVLGKSLAYFANSVNASIVLGARAPIILPSRAGKIESKWASIALGSLMV